MKRPRHPLFMGIWWSLVRTWPACQEVDEDQRAPDLIALHHVAAAHCDGVTAQQHDPPFCVAVPNDLVYLEHRTRTSTSSSSGLSQLG